MYYLGQSSEELVVKDLTTLNQHELTTFSKNGLLILWNIKGEIDLYIDLVEYRIAANRIVFLTEFHKVTVRSVSLVRLIRLNRSFYCIIDHDEEVGCNVILFYGSSHVPLFTVSDEDAIKFQPLWEILSPEKESWDKLQQEILHMMLKRFVILSTRLLKKQFWKPNRHIGISGAVNLKAGTLWTGISSYTVIRTGKINDLFNGFISHYHTVKPVNGQTRFQLYALMKPSISYNLKNTLISGGLFEAKSRQKPEAREEEQESAIPRKMAYGYDYGLVISVNKLSLEITQKASTADIRGNRKHEVGNISIYKVF